MFLLVLFPCSCRFHTISGSVKDRTEPDAKAQIKMWREERKKVTVWSFTSSPWTACFIPDPLWCYPPINYSLPAGKWSSAHLYCCSLRHHPRGESTLLILEHFLALHPYGNSVLGAPEEKLKMLIPPLQFCVDSHNPTFWKSLRQRPMNPTTTPNMSGVRNNGRFCICVFPSEPSYWTTTKPFTVILQLAESTDEQKHLTKENQTREKEKLWVWLSHLALSVQALCTGYSI